VARGVEAAEAAYERGHYVAGALVTSRTRRAIALAESVDHGDEDAVQRVVAQIAAEIGTGVQTQEAVPTAIGFLYLRDGDPWRTILDDTNAGGDSDTIAAIAGAMGGALMGSTALPASVAAQLDAVNHLRLEDHADRLLRIRQQG
jgi:ADP-ribosylglycohydrolase